MALNVIRRLHVALTPPPAHTNTNRAQPRTAEPRDAFDLGRAGTSAAKLERDRTFVTGLYRELLGREPDVEGFAAHLNGLRGGMSHDDIRQVFLTSPEYAERQAALNAPAPQPAPAPTTPPAPALPPEPGAALSTVPMRAEYTNIAIDRSSPAAAAKSAAEWVRRNKPEYFDKGDDRQVAFEMMTWVTGALRANGFDAHRVVNHPSRAVGDGLRYGSDAVVVNGRVYDVYVAWGDPGRGDPTAQDMGPYAAGRLRE
ncbi:MAG: DUF4214 domain-containing protein [Myxococcaceae bacterium]|nr:DUF4214 domain-containing protein [Myxococcaceae bacterium]